jgi:hypothetical protein
LDLCRCSGEAGLHQQLAHCPLTAVFLSQVTAVFLSQVLSLAKLKKRKKEKRAIGSFSPT